MRALPTAAGWTLIINSDLGNDDLPAKDVVRIPLRKRTLSVPVESFTFWLIPSRAEGGPAGELRFAWGDVELSADWRVP